MNKITINSLVPQLRFPEFENDGEWGEKSLGQLSKKVTAKNKENLINRVFTNSATDGIVDQRDYFDKDIANQNNLVGYFIVEQGDYVYNPRCSKTAPVGPINKNYLGQGVMSPLYTVFRFKEKDNEFYNHYFKFDTWHKYLLAIANSGARHDRMSITSADFMKMPLPYPSPSEQQKIADCLSSIDELIVAESQKLDAYKDHKKGLMQKLFPADGTKVPQFRFPEFVNDGEWVEKNGNDLFAPISNKKHNSDLPILAISQEYGAVPREMIDYTVIATSKSVASYKVVEIGDFIISLRSFQGGIEYSTYKGICSPAYIILKNKLDISEIFYKYYFKTHLFIANMCKNLEGLRDGKMVSYKQFSELKIQYPTVSEQQKIADCLSSIDELITAQNEKIESLKEHKRGLMQQLFPKA